MNYDNELPNNTYFHIYSDGKVSGTIFKDDEDFIYAKNLLAICSFSNHIILLSFALMDTHFHLVAECNPLNCDKFITQFKQRLINYLSVKYHESPCITIRPDPMNTRDELLGKIIYAYKNPTASGYQALPEYYPWGVGQLYFAGDYVKTLKGSLVGMLSIKKQRSMFHTMNKIPQDWEYDEKGMILTKCYVDYERVNRIFGSPKTFIAFMHTKKDNDIQISIHCHQRIIDNMTETECRKQVAIACKSQFNKSLSRLLPEEKISLARYMKILDPGYSIKRLSRIIGIDSSLLEMVLK